MDFNFPIILLAAAIPLLTGFIYYHPSVVGAAWMKAADMTEEKMKSGSMAKTFITAYFFGLLIALGLFALVVHQSAIYSILANEPGMKDPNSEVSLWLKDFMDHYGRNFRTFKHGAFHGTLAGIFLALPIGGMTALFERRGAKYIIIHAVYFVITLALMGGVICQWV